MIRYTSISRESDFRRIETRTPGGQEYVTISHCGGGAAIYRRYLTDYESSTMKSRKVMKYQLVGTKKKNVFPDGSIRYAVLHLPDR
jgi:hypothetical protein